MRLEEQIRHRLFAGETVELPLGDRPLRRDAVYAIHTDKGTRQGQFRVLVIRKGVALIRYEGDPVRLLSQSGGDHEGCGYTDFPGRAMRGVSGNPTEGPLHDAGEAVDEATQRRISKGAYERSREHRRAERTASERLTLERRLATLRDLAKRRRVDVSGDLRQIEKRIETIERKLEAA